MTERCQEEGPITGSRHQPNTTNERSEDFRNFRLDRIKSLEVLGRVYASEPGRSLQDYYASMAERYEHHEDG